MLSSQRALFDVPRDVCYLNSAGWSPLPLATQEAARSAVNRKGQPWKLPATFASDMNERTRAAAARLINADPADVALVSSIAYGVATAAKLFAPPKGSRVLVLENDHTSPVLEWHSRSQTQGFTIDAVPQPADGDWTAAVLSAIDRAGTPPLSLVSISSIHWSDGGLVDIAAVTDRAKAKGAAVLIDATHGAGVMAIDVKTLDPDFLLFPTYKWTLGPYGRAFAYVAKRHQTGIPLEQTSYGRRDVRAEQDVYFADIRYLPDARRFDMGEKDHFISMEMAAMGMELLAGWGLPAVEARLDMLTSRIASGLEGTRIKVPARRVRAPNVLSVALPTGANAREVVASLATESIYVAPRLGRVRISPHVYNDEADCDRICAALRKRFA